MDEEKVNKLFPADCCNLQVLVALHFVNNTIPLGKCFFKEYLLIVVANISTGCRFPINHHTYTLSPYLTLSQAFYYRYPFASIDDAYAWVDNQPGKLNCALPTRV